MKFGIVLRDKHLVYGARQGAFLGWPYWFQSPIVKVWNFIACRLFGHRYVFAGLCTSCCRWVH